MAGGGGGEIYRLAPVIKATYLSITGTSTDHVLRSYLVIRNPDLKKV